MNFKVMNRDEAKEYVKNICRELQIEKRREQILDYVSDFFYSGDEVALGYTCHCLTVRIYDGEEYIFVCPFPCDDSAFIADACEEIRKYAVREDIPIVIVDVAEEEIPDVTEPFRFTVHQDVFDDGSVYIVRPLSEAERYGKIPKLTDGDVTIDQIVQEDTESYADLCQNEITNRLYGYDYKEDFSSPEPSLFYKIAMHEQETGKTAPFAIRYKEKFVGEAVLFSFDYLGGAKVAIRLLPEFFSLGIGSKALALIIGFAREIELKELKTEVKLENAPSMKMTERFMQRIEERTA